ncbi:MAG: tRNA pseudouridine(38-40) synthase TruA [Candidatus Zixiibacteriota bacterium]
MAEKNIRLDIEYDGTRFSGWQVQANANTIQGYIEEALEKITGQKVAIHSAGRTDAGVHALGQVANFWIDHHIAPEKYKDALNYYLPHSILIINASETEPGFHARKSAKWRHYQYRIGRRKSALHFNHRWEYEYPLDISRMNEIAQFILGVHDFAAFCVVSSLKENNESNIMQSGWIETEDELIYEVRGNRFLHTMVRSLVGTMVQAGREKDYLTLTQFKDILNSLDHTKIITVAPARGLYLKAVGY